MRSRSVIPVAALLLALAGCGGSKHSSSTPVPATQPTASITTSSPPVHKPGAAAHPSRPHPAPRPAGPPAPPAGLRASSGYSTYELCAGSCSGAVPSSIRRPLHAPSSCNPQSSGSVTPSPSTSLATNSFIGSPWRGGRVTWSVSGYSGPILIRGRQIGGSGAIGFGEGHVPYDELQLQGSGPFPSFTRVQSTGCYFYQVDGTSFSSTIVFRAT